MGRSNTERRCPSSDRSGSCSTESMDNPPSGEPVRNLTPPVQIPDRPETSFEQARCSGLDLDALELLRTGSQGNVIGEELVSFVQNSSNFSSGSGKELLDIILNDESIQGTSATELIRAASMRSDGGVLCDELLQLSDNQLSEFLRRPLIAPGLNHATSTEVPATARVPVVSSEAVGAQAWRANQQSIHQIPCCPAGHQCAPIIKVDGVYAGGEFACDKCSNVCQVSTERWHCGLCSVDFCYACTPRPGKNQSFSLPAGPNSRNSAMQWSNSANAINSGSGPHRPTPHYPTAEVKGTQKRRAKVVYPKGETIHWNRKKKPARDEESPRSKVNEYSRSKDNTDLDDGVDEWEGHRVLMKKGKYEGRGALVKKRINKKYRVMVDGVEDQLEFYPTSFAHTTDKVIE